MLVPTGYLRQPIVLAAGTDKAATPVLNESVYRYITVGKTYDFNVKHAPKGATYSWKSDHSQFATVNKDGVVKGIKEGNSIITCDIKAKGKTFQLKATVYVKSTSKNPAKGIKMTNKTTEVTVGINYDLNTAMDPVKATDFVNWTSSDTGIATVNENGMVKGVNEGKVTITATTLSGKSDKVTLNVIKKIPDQLTAVYGTPVLDGEIDSIWDTAEEVVPKLYGANKTEVTATHRLMWDDNALYILTVIKDSVLDDKNTTPYAQDSLELFLDEDNAKDTAYKSDDLHYRVNYKNIRTVDAGDRARFYSKTKVTKTGYVVEACIVWDKTTKPANNKEFGMELQINDAKNGSRLSTINVFDITGMSFQNPSLFGKLVLTGKTKDAVTASTCPYILLSYIDRIKTMSLDAYINKDVIKDDLANAEKVAANANATQEEIDNAYKALQSAVLRLDDGSGLVKPDILPVMKELPDAFTFLDGSKVTTLNDWEKRKDEIARMYEYYMYGKDPDTSAEKVTMEYVKSFTMAGMFGPMTLTAQANQKFVKINIARGSKKVDFVAAITFPSKTDRGTVKLVPPTHEGGYPVVIVIGSLGNSQKQYLNENGYAVIEFGNNEIAADDGSRTGDFYSLYPYGNTWDTQTGVLMAWGWGVSKIVDMLELDASGKNELQISPVNTIVTGVSRNGKAAAVAGAFDDRIKVTVPASSGESGMAAFRYSSSGKSYNYKSLTKEEFIDFKGEVDGTAVWNNYQRNPVHKVGSNESLSNSQGSGHWFNTTFQDFQTVDQLPFDQHLLVALTADKDRYYLITGEIDGGDWINPAAMYVTYLAAQNIYDSLGINGNIGIHLHATGHALTLEDTKYLVEFCNKNLYGIVDGKMNLKDLKTSIFEEPVNYDPYLDMVKAMNGPDLSK
jgi:endo-1,4-beta-xylanase